MTQKTSNDIKRMYDTMCKNAESLNIKEKDLVVLQEEVEKLKGSIREQRKNIAIEVGTHNRTLTFNCGDHALILKSEQTADGPQLIVKIQPFAESDDELSS